MFYDYSYEFCGDMCKFNTVMWCANAYVCTMWCYWIKDEVLKLATYLPKINKAEQGIRFDSIAPNERRGLVERAIFIQRDSEKQEETRGKTNLIVVWKIISAGRLAQCQWYRFTTLTIMYELMALICLNDNKNCKVKLFQL